MKLPPPALPLDAPLCPICGNPNSCAASAAASFEVDCWCKELDFSESLLSRVPPGSMGKACICRSCAEVASAENISAETVAAKQKHGD